MTEEKIDRINALAHKQQAVGLTEEEKEELFEKLQKGDMVARAKSEQ